MLALEGGECVDEQLALVLANATHAEGAQVVRGRAEADPGGDIRRAGLELPRDVVPLRTPEVDLTDHVAARHERRHRLQELAPRPERAGSRRAEHLVPRERVEV